MPGCSRLLLRWLGLLHAADLGGPQQLLEVGCIIGGRSRGSGTCGGLVLVPIAHIKHPDSSQHSRTHRPANTQVWLTTRPRGAADRGRSLPALRRKALATVGGGRRVQPLLSACHRPTHTNPTSRSPRWCVFIHMEQRHEPDGASGEGLDGLLATASATASLYSLTASVSDFCVLCRQARPMPPS